VRRLVVISAPYRREGWFPEVLAAMAQVSAALLEQMRRSELFEAWAGVAPDVNAIGGVMDKTGALLRMPYDWSDEVVALAAPVLLVFADADSVPSAYAAEFFALLDGACATRAGTGRWRAPRVWRSCRGARTTTCAPRPGWEPSSRVFCADGTPAVAGTTGAVARPCAQPGSQPSR
jgi:hypothetical protein